MKQSIYPPIENRLFKISGIGVEHHPVLWVSADRIKGIELISPPPPGYVAPQLDIDTNEKLTFRRVGTDFNFEAQVNAQRRESIQPSMNNGT